MSILSTRQMLLKEAMKKIVEHKIQVCGSVNIY